MAAFDRAWEHIEDFASRKNLALKTRVKAAREGGWPYLDLTEPAVLARFAAEVKQEHDGQVFFRGQTSHHPEMLPSLFRQRDARAELLDLERDLHQRLSSIEDLNNRFPNGKCLTPALQHYGFNTSWLDVVDNLWMSVWFATHDLQEVTPGLSIVNRSDRAYGWVYLIGTKGGELKTVDMRTTCAPKAYRPHIQHAACLRCEKKKKDADLQSYVLATVRFPNDPRWTLSGGLWGARALFPPVTLDRTLKLLLRSEVRSHTKDAEGGWKGVLGGAFEVRDVEDAQALYRVKEEGDRWKVRRLWLSGGGGASPLAPAGRASAVLDTACEAEAEAKRLAERSAPGYVITYRNGSIDEEFPIWPVEDISAR